MNRVTKPYRSFTFTLALVSVFCFWSAAAFAGQWRVTTNFQERNALISVLNQIVSEGKTIDGFAETTQGNWLIASGSDVWASSGFSNGLTAAVRHYVGLGHRVVAADCNAASGCLVIYNNWGRHKVGPVPGNVLTRLNEFQNKQWPVRDVELTNTGYVLLGPGRTVGWGGSVPYALKQALADTHKSDRTITALSLGLTHEWALVAGHNPMFHGISSALSNRLDTIARSGAKISNLTIARDNGYFVHTRGSEVPNNTSTLANMEWRLGEDGSTNIWQRMDEQGVAGVSIALVKNNSVTGRPQVVATRGYGKKKADENHGHVLTSTRFALASLSKYLGALTTLRYSALNGIDLDDNIFDFAGTGHLSTWQFLGNNNLLNDIYGIDDKDLVTPISLRQLLSHTAGFPTRGARRVPRALWAEAEALTSVHWLLGWECFTSTGACTPNGTSGAWQTADPGAQFAYSNEGYSVIQAALEDASGESMDTLLQNYLFNVVGMPTANAQIQKPVSYLNQTAWQHGDSPASDWVSHSNKLASNIYSSSKDYAEAMIVALNEGRTSAGQFVIPAWDNHDLLSRQPFDGGVVNRGLSVVLAADAVEGSGRSFEHGGDFSSRARTFMCGNPTENEGIVVLMNTNTAPARRFLRELVGVFNDSVGWGTAAACTP